MKLTRRRNEHSERWALGVELYEKEYPVKENDRNQWTQQPTHSSRVCVVARKLTWRFTGILLVLLTAGYLPAHCQSNSGSPAVIPKEKIEWTWSDHSDTIDPKLPNVLLVGDSITRGYFPEVAKRLAGKANVYLFATSCSSGDPRLTEQLHLYFETAPSFRVIHFNNGMHGWDYSETDFAAGLPGMIEELTKERSGARLIWGTITGVRKDNNLGATNARVAARNALAIALMKHDGISIDDQHALMEGHGDLHLDDVHFNDRGSELQGDQATATIEAALGFSTTSSPQ